MLEIKRRLDPRFFDLVILDMIMPEMNGSETFKRLKKWIPGAKYLYPAYIP
jgi:CheY-like chemotaxis protein